MLSVFKVQFPFCCDVLVLGLDAGTLDPVVQLGSLSLDATAMRRLYDDFKRQIISHYHRAGPVTKHQLGPDHGLVFHNFLAAVSIEQRPEPSEALPKRMTPGIEGWTALWNLEVPIKATLNRLETYSKRALSWIHSFAKDLLSRSGNYGPYKQYLTEEDTIASQRFWISKQFEDHWEATLLNVDDALPRQLLRELCASDDTLILDEMMSLRHGVKIDREVAPEPSELPSLVFMEDEDEKEKPAVEALFKFDHSGVVSTYCAELNSLLQYFGYETAYAPKVLLASKPSAAMKIGLRMYIPLEREVRDVDQSVEVIRYHNKTNLAALSRDYSEWLSEQMGANMQRDLHFLNGQRFYVSTLYFDSPWDEWVKFKLVGKANFYTPSGAAKTRHFMEVDMVLPCMTTALFEVISIPYRSKNHYIAYIFPHDISVSLTSVWEMYVNHCRNNEEGGVMGGFERVRLRVPTVSHLETEITLPSNPFVFSKMVSSITINEKGTKATSIVETTCTDGAPPESRFIDINRPYMAVVHDVKLDCMLFVLKDNGLKIK